MALISFDSLQASICLHNVHFAGTPQHTAFGLAQHLLSGLLHHCGIFYFASHTSVLTLCVHVCLLQRYISTRPLFIDARELALGQGAAQVTDTSSAITALRSLAALYKAIIQAVRDEAMIMEQVFLSPADALVMFVTRLFEQRVQARDHEHRWNCMLLVGCCLTWSEC